MGRLCSSERWEGDTRSVFGGEDTAAGSVLVAYQPTFRKVTDVIQTGEMAPAMVFDALRVCAESFVQVSELFRTVL